MGDMQTMAIDRNAVCELAPEGKLRAGVVRAPQGGVFFVSVDEQAQPVGVTVDLIRQFARDLQLEPVFSVFPNSGECTDAVASGGIDIAFMPVDAERRRKVDFGPAYYLLRSTFLLAAGTGIRTIADYRQRGRRFVGIAGTTTLRAAIRTFGAERAVEARGVDEAMAQFAGGAVDAVALSEDYLAMAQPNYPGSSVMEDAFQETSISVALPRQRPLAFALAGRLLEQAKSSGQVRAIFDRNGLSGEAVAPVGS